MTPIQALFETHLPVADLPRSLHFYRDLLGLPLAQIFDDRKVAFLWLGAPPHRQMLGLWESGSGPNKLQLHIAFAVSLDDLLQAPQTLKTAGIQPLDFHGNPAHEPQVLTWMPAASLYFRDPDGHMLEFISMLDEHAPDPTQGVVAYSDYVPKPL